MAEVTLLINSPEGSTEVSLDGEPVTVGRTDSSSIVIAADTGLSRRHASFYRRHESVWVTDENSTNGSFVNGAPVPREGVKLSDGDEVSIGNYTTITIRISPDGFALASVPASVATPSATGHADSPAPPIASGGGPSIFLLIIPVGVIIAILFGAVGFILYRRGGAAERYESGDSGAALSESSPDASPEIFEDTGADIV